MPFLTTPSSWQNFSIGVVSLAQTGNVERDSLGNLYFPTDQGVAKYDISTDSVSFIDTTDGLVANLIGSIAVDSNDDLWVLQQPAVSILSGDVVLQKYDTTLNSVAASYTLLTLFGIKATYGGGRFVKINPFNGDVFVGETNISGFSSLARFNGAVWSMIGSLTMGFSGGTEDIDFIDFLTATDWWVGSDVGGGIPVTLVLFDSALVSTTFSFTGNVDFGGAAVIGIALLSSGRLLVTVLAGNIFRIDSGIVSDSLNTMSSHDSGFFLDRGEVVWGYAPKANLTGVTSFDDATTTKIDFTSGTIGGSSSAAGGIDLDGNVWFARGPDATAILTKGVLATIPIFTTLEVRAAGSTTIDLRTISDSNSTSFAVTVPDGAPAPSSVQVKAGQDSSGSPVAPGFAASNAVTENVENPILSFLLTNLAPLTDYDVYIVGDGSGGCQATPTKLDVSTTSAGKIPQDKLPFLITVGGQRVF